MGLIFGVKELPEAELPKAELPAEPKEKGLLLLLAPVGLAPVSAPAVLLRDFVKSERLKAAAAGIGLAAATIELVAAVAAAGEGVTVGTAGAWN